jgi:hypothetical protein
MSASNLTFFGFFYPFFTSFLMRSPCLKYQGERIRACSISLQNSQADTKWNKSTEKAEMV